MTTQTADRLTSLDEKKRGELFTWMRNCPYDDAVKQFLRELGLEDVTRQELNDFFQREARRHWEVRIGRAAQEANALLQVVDDNPTRFSTRILAALGQEAFRQMASGEVSPDAMVRMTNLFLRARGDERAEQALELKRKQATEKALDVFAAEIGEHPGARQALETLRQELLGDEANPE